MEEYWTNQVLYYESLSNSIAVAVVSPKKKDSPGAPSASPAPLPVSSKNSSQPAPNVAPPAEEVPAQQLLSYKEFMKEAGAHQIQKEQYSKLELFHVDDKMVPTICNLLVELAPKYGFSKEWGPLNFQHVGNYCWLYVKTKKDAELVKIRNALMEAGFPFVRMPSKNPGSIEGLTFLPNATDLDCFIHKKGVVGCLFRHRKNSSEANQLCYRWERGVECSFGCYNTHRGSTVVSLKMQKQPPFCEFCKSKKHFLFECSTVTSKMEEIDKLLEPNEFVDLGSLNIRSIEGVSEILSECFNDNMEQLFALFPVKYCLKAISLKVSVKRIPLMLPKKKLVAPSTPTQAAASPAPAPKTTAPTPTKPSAPMLIPAIAVPMPSEGLLPKNTNPIVFGRKGRRWGGNECMEFFGDIILFTKITAIDFSIPIDLVRPLIEFGRTVSIYTPTQYNFATIGSDIRRLGETIANIMLLNFEPIINEKNKFLDFSTINAKLGQYRPKLSAALESLRRICNPAVHFTVSGEVSQDDVAEGFYYLRLAFCWINDSTDVLSALAAPSPRQAPQALPVPAPAQPAKPKNLLSEFDGALSVPASSTTADKSPKAKKKKTNFKVKCHTEFGQSVYVCNSVGNWKPLPEYQMTFSTANPSEHIWEASLRLPIGTEYKYVIVHGSQVIWEPTTKNRFVKSKQMDDVWSVIA